MHRQLIRMMRYVPVEVFYYFTAIFVIPVCLIVNPAQRIIYRYFRDCHHASPVRAALMTYRNFYLFAQVVIDRFAMYGGRRFDVDVEGYDNFQQLAERKEGFLQLSAHVGNYEIAGYTLIADKKRLNALVFDKEKATVMENRGRLFSVTNIRMIAVKQDMSHLFTINEALADGETVSMPADRMLGSTKGVTLNFMGKEAVFPLGPFTVATMRGLNVLAVNVMKTGTKRYKIYVTPLRYDKEKPRAEQTTQLARAYADELERMLRLYPEQWYNYFSFWK
ncbi:MAG: lysophospholipid acyltransferase family protein [Prevotella sp.]|nr:lysophospholipid acyltransferase family protein [Prevotella sp.]